MINIKTIGVILRKFIENEKVFMGTRNDLWEFLKEFKVNLIGIPISLDFENIKEIINICDGIILPGGDNLNINDFKLVKYLKEYDIPTLGICLGMQVICEEAGSSEIEVKNHNSRDLYVHKVIINRESLLYNILKKDEIVVNSRHNSAIESTNYKINVLSLDGIIEGIEDSSKTFFMGLLWHPESLKDENSYKILNYFINIIKKDK